MNEPEADLRILLIDDEEVTLRSLGQRVLERMGYQVLYADNGEKGLQVFAEEEIDIVISDIKMPGMDGIELLRRLKGQPQDVEVILITGHGDMDMAVEALKAGAFDMLTKPIEVQEIITVLQRTRRYQEMCREKERIQQELELLRRSGREAGEEGEIIGESKAIQRVQELIGRVAGAEQTTVLIQGESGTGKELVARAIHRQSSRADRPFVSINCTAIPEHLLESELFGHEKGAFTDAREQRKGLIELAHGGTLFLDEIGDMSLPAQAKILRVLEERRVRRVGGDREIAVDVRLISATNQDLQAWVEEGRFRRDLYFRLHVFNIDLPPLHRRGDDVLLLAHHFLYEVAREFRKEVKGIDPAAQAMLKGYSFPGNVRELHNIIERAVILCEGQVVKVEQLPDGIGDPKPISNGGDNEEGGSLPGSLDLEELEAWAIREALRRTDGKKVEAARHLGINDDALRRRMRKHGIE
jgi:two-component system, NtrC family, response regulator AtoC